MRLNTKHITAKLLAAFIAAALITAPAAAFELPCYLQPGDACKGAPGADGADGAPGLDGIDGEDGIDGADGNDGRDADPAGLAIAMALSTPNWLEANESVAFSGGWGVFDGRHAIAGTGILRLDHSWAFTGGIAADTRFDVWGARAGIRSAW